MDLRAADLADLKPNRLTRVSMMVCFVIASGMLLASLAMARGATSQTLVTGTLNSSSLN